MKTRIIKSINQCICKYFGHNTVEDVYAIRCDKLFGFPESNSKKAKYLIGYLLTKDVNAVEILNALYPHLCVGQNY